MGAFKLRPLTKQKKKKQRPLTIMATASPLYNFRITVRKDSIAAWQNFTGKTKKKYFSYMLKKACRLYTSTKGITMAQVVASLELFQNVAIRNDYLGAFVDAKLHRNSKFTENRMQFVENVMSLYPAAEEPSVAAVPRPQEDPRPRAPPRAPLVTTSDSDHGWLCCLFAIMCVFLRVFAIMCTFLHMIACFST